MKLYFLHDGFGSSDGFGFINCDLQLKDVGCFLKMSLFLDKELLNQTQH